MTGLRVRKERRAPDSLMVVRGGDLSEEEIRRDALRAHRRFGEYGISAFGAPSDRALDEIARGPLVRFDVLTLFTAGELRRSSLELRPTFRRPHYTVMLPVLDEDLERLLRCENERQINVHFQPEDLQT
jgi:hypothetical protein